MRRRSATPTPLSRFAAMPNCRPMTTASIPSVVAIGWAKTTLAVAMPTKAPITVGTMVSARRR